MSSIGFGLSPASGRAIMELATEGRCLFTDLAPPGLARFKDIPRDWRERKGWVPIETLEEEALGGA